MSPSDADAGEDGSGPSIHRRGAASRPRRPVLSFHCPRTQAQGMSPSIDARGSERGSRVSSPCQPSGRRLPLRSMLLLRRLFRALLFLGLLGLLLGFFLPFHSLRHGASSVESGCVSVAWRPAHSPSLTLPSASGTYSRHSAARRPRKKLQCPSERSRRDEPAIRRWRDHETDQRSSGIPETSGQVAEHRSPWPRQPRARQLRAS
jgi:hypothetical protein